MPTMSIFVDYPALERIHQCLNLNRVPPGDRNTKVSLIPSPSEPFEIQVPVASLVHLNPSKREAYLPLASLLT